MKKKYLLILAVFLIGILVFIKLSSPSEESKTAENNHSTEVTDHDSDENDTSAVINQDQQEEAEPGKHENETPIDYADYEDVSSDDQNSSSGNTVSEPVKQDNETAIDYADEETNVNQKQEDASSAGQEPAKTEEPEKQTATQEDEPKNGTPTMEDIELEDNEIIIGGH